MSTSKANRLLGNREMEDRYLKLAAITDIRFAVKENEALPALISTRKASFALGCEHAAADSRRNKDVPSAKDSCATC